MQRILDWGETPRGGHVRKVSPLAVDLRTMLMAWSASVVVLEVGLAMMKFTAGGLEVVEVVEVVLWVG